MFSLQHAAVRRCRRLPFIIPTPHLRRCYAFDAASIPLKPAMFGQPVFQSHPHLSRSFIVRNLSVFGVNVLLVAVGPDELTPGITRQEYESRRRNLMDGLPENSIVVLMAGKIKYMSGSA
jgi:intermediate cleaving peptidase 55